MFSLLFLLAISTFAGFLGALLGLGGGIIVVPILTLFFHVNIRYAIAASLISIVATSSGAAMETPLVHQSAPAVADPPLGQTGESGS